MSPRRARTRHVGFDPPNFASPTGSSRRTCALAFLLSVRSARDPQRGPERRRGPLWRTAMLWVASGEVAVRLLLVVR